MRALKNPLIRTGGLLVVLLILLAVAAPLLSRWHVLHEPVQQDQAGLDGDGMPLPVGGKYLLGTDNLGRDVLSRVVHGTRISLTVGVAAMLTATLLGVAVGVAAGLYGKKMDGFLMRLTDMSMTIPGILLAVAFAGVMTGRTVHPHPSGLPWHFLDVELKRGMVSLFLIIGIICWPGMARVVRGQVLALKERDFILAARSLGASNRQLIFWHILPNILPTVIALAALNTANTIMLEAGLGYLGIGVPAPAPTWGGMIADGQPYFSGAPHLVIVPGVAIVITVLAFNLLGQGLQEVMDRKQSS